MGAIEVDLSAVAVADHVPVEHDAAHASQMDTTSLDVIAGSVLIAFGAGCQ